MGLLKSNLITLAGGVSTPTVDPTLVLDLEFSSMTALPASITFTRASVATYFDQNGALQTALANAARFDHDPTTLEPLGLLLEVAGTNSLLNSAAPGTQNVTVTAAPWTLSFYGTGSVALSGAYVGTLVGTGPFPARASLTFTPTAGTLTLTVTGSVTQAQLELGPNPTSYIATTAAAATRAVEAASMTGANFSGWYNAPTGTFCIAARSTAKPASGSTQYVFTFGADGTNFQNVNLYSEVVVYLGAYTVSAQPSITIGTIAAKARFQAAFNYVEGDKRGSLNGAGVVSDAYTLGPATKLSFGATQTGSVTGGLAVASLKYYNVAKSDAELIELTTP